jgi:hypothetical protein
MAVANSQIIQVVLNNKQSPLNHKEIIMKLNVGGFDRIARIIAGLVLIGLAAAGMIGVWGYIGLVPLLTGIFKFCPAYTLLGMNTCPMKKD